MRIWSVHPKYLDTKGLGGVWRETLLAKAVFEGKTKGYTKHPQLNRFRETSDPVKYISTYLSTVHEEAAKRGFKYDGSKVGEVGVLKPVPVTKGQLEYEWHHLLKKLKKRSPEWLAKIPQVSLPDTHPIFEVVEGDIASWEVVQAPQPKGKSRKRKSLPDDESTSEKNDHETEDGKSDSDKDSAGDSIMSRRSTRSSVTRSHVNNQKARSAASSNVSYKTTTTSQAKKSGTGPEKPVERRCVNSAQVPDTEQPSERNKKGRSSRQAVEQTMQVGSSKKDKSSRKAVEQSEHIERSEKGRSVRQAIEQTEPALIGKKFRSSGRNKK